MGLSTKNVTPQSGSGGIKITDGVYANLKTITKVRDISGKKLEFTDKIFDIVLEIEFEGDRFPQTFLGNLKRDASGQVVDWGGAFVVAMLFTNVGMEAELNDEDRFSTKDLKALVGEQLYVVSYTAGTYKNKSGGVSNNYNNWNQTFPPIEEEETVQQMVLEAWQKSRDKGYPKDYTFPQKSTSGSRDMSQSNTSKAGKSDLASDVDYDDDDLPF